MRIAIAASEAAPFAKTGGLADVVGALPKALHQLGCEVKVFMPKYSTIDEAKYDLHYEYGIGEMPIGIGGTVWPVHVQRSALPGSPVEIYFIDCPYFFHRKTIYTNDPDEDERFILFSKAVIETLQRLQWAPDVIHCNDWQTALIPVLLKRNYKWDMLFDRTATLLSIHNIGYQGLFSRSALQAAELGEDLYYPGGPLEMNNAVCFLKAGILFSEIIGTVSETYAHEILTPEYGAGMENILRTREHDLFGVINGIDDDIWNPDIDHHLPFHYSPDRIEGKLENKQFLLRNTGLPFSEHRPLIGIISRLVVQKGFDLVADAIHDLMMMDAQWAVLGSGEIRFENLFSSIAHTLPHKVWTYIGFNNELAHLIEAGADMFLMPSRYEPCGLNQMYSLRYGTVPIVRKTGGLADTVQDWHEFEAQGLDIGNGFSFDDATGHALSTSVRQALEVFKRKPLWRKIQMNGMTRDFSWKASAKKYVALYEKAIARKP
ncbi:MAG: glycogen synthase GlgA [Bacteroidota bacterium]